LEKLRLSFQKHKDRVVDLNHPVTVLVGPTDCGKSSVLRALRWVCLNKLAGKPSEYPPWGKDGMRVTLWLDGRRVTRFRKGGENKYLLDGSEFVAFRDGVPDEIASLLAVDADNFQKQMDPQFWLSDSAGQVAKNLNQIVNLEVMDESQARCQAALRKAKLELEISTERLQKAREDRKGLLWVREAEALLSNLEKIDERLDLKRSTLASAGRTLAAVQNATLTRDRAATGLPEGLIAVAVGARHAKVAARVNRARKLLAEIRMASGAVGRGPPDLGPMLALRKKCDDAAEDRRKGEELLDTIRTQEKALCRIREELSATSILLKRLQPRKCPTCGQRIHKSLPSCAATYT